ncbi:MAG: aldo/keto reductase [Saccharofermentanales bacterium]
MNYKEFGNTGVKISALGFGAMRLPMITINGESVVDEDLAIPMIRKAYDLGVNYFDTAYFYCGGHSEAALGKAVKGIRDDIYISTKFPYWTGSDKFEYRRILEIQLKRLDTDHVDFYHFHGLNGSGFRDAALKNGFIDEAIRAKEEGLIKHISFSFHDVAEEMKFLVDTGHFETLLCQYNFLDRSNEESIEYARKKGIGIVVMGPVAGGRISGMSPEVADKLGIKVRNTSELALRFVMANPNVDCALSGMSNIQMVEENALTASRSDVPLTDKELDALKGLLDDYKKLSDLYCTGCNYCQPCPQGVNIPFIFSQMNNYRIYGIKEAARAEYAAIGAPGGQTKGEKADKCIECGICEGLCPQKIEIMKQLRECAEALG